MKQILLLALSILFGCTTLTTSQDDTIVASAKRPAKIAGEQMTIEFTKHVSGYPYLSRLALNDQQGLLKVPSDEWSRPELAPIWEVKFHGPDVFVTGKNAKFLGWHMRKNSIVLRWHHEKEPQFEAEVVVQVDDASGATRWNMTIDADDEVALRRVVFPIIGDIKNSSAQSGDVKLGAPAHWGEEYYQAENANYRGYYPSSRCVMQYMAYYNEESGEGLYYAAEDTKGHNKLFRNRMSEKQRTAARAEITYFPIVEESSKWSTPYPIVIAPFEGNWYEASKIYRNWMVENAPWALPNSSNKELWLRDNAAWFYGKFKSDTTQNFLNAPDIDNYAKLARHLDVPSAIHLYHWHKYPFDDMYPEYFPARKGLAEFLDDMHAEGVKVVPYINGRISDIRMADKDARFEQAANALRWRTSRKFRQEHYHGHDFFVMCPDAQFWQDKIFEVVTTLETDYKFDGVYFDQVCNSAAIKCSNPGHGHPPDPEDDVHYSTGTRWTDGYREMFEQINSKFHRGNDFITMSEDNAETWNDQVDAFLIYNADITDTATTFRQVPMFPAAYGGYSTTVGFADYNAANDKYRDMIGHKLARGFVWGSQVGWVYPTKFYRQPLLIDYFAALAKVRYAIRDHINYGELLQEPQISPEIEPLAMVETVKLRGKHYPTDVAFSPVVAAFWGSGDAGVVLVTNYTGQDLSSEELKIKINLRESNLSPGAYKIRYIGPGGEIKSFARRIGTDTYAFEIEMSAYAVLAIEIQQLN